MANYKSQYTGAQIDEAVGKVLNGGSGGGTQLYKHVLTFSATVEGVTVEQPLHIITLESKPLELQNLASELNHRYTKLAVYLYDGSAMTPVELFSIVGGGWVVAMSDYSTAKGKSYIYVEGDITSIIETGTAI